MKVDEDAHGSVNLEWSYPCFNRLRCHAQIFHGYGVNLIDYNYKLTSVGLGVALVEWF
jgi:phospholipase A1